jgi:hypothetical protein
MALPEYVERGDGDAAGYSGRLRQWELIPGDRSGSPQNADND